MNSVVFDVHFVQAGLCGCVLDGHGAVLVVGDVRLGHFTRRHSDFTFTRGTRTRGETGRTAGGQPPGAALATTPVISPFWMVNGMTRSKGLSPATSTPLIPIGLSVACRGRRQSQESDGNKGLQ